VEGQKTIENGIPGEMICTGLLNADMPLIRYRIGDRASVERGGDLKNCACGRALPQVASLEGRVDDVLYSRDGRRIGRLDPAFKGTLPIHEAQIIQETLERIRVRYVPAQGFGAKSREQIVRAIRDYVGSVEVILEEVDQIPREPNGKFRAVICKLNTQAKNRSLVLESA
jgi:phenylacetate-CoA ligase